jgi:hypothetical protein
MLWIWFTSLSLHFYNIFPDFEGSPKTYCLGTDKMTEAEVHTIIYHLENGPQDMTHKSCTLPGWLYQRQRWSCSTLTLSQILSDAHGWPFLTKPTPFSCNPVGIITMTVLSVEIPFKLLSPHLGRWILEPHLGYIFFFFPITWMYSTNLFTAWLDFSFCSYLLVLTMISNMLLTTIPLH